jgi:hypothetical protein
MLGTIVVVMIAIIGAFVIWWASQIPTYTHRPLAVQRDRMAAERGRRTGDSGN